MEKKLNNIGHICLKYNTNYLILNRNLNIDSILSVHCIKNINKMFPIFFLIFLYHNENIYLK